jgi:phage terminase small subunit
MAGKPGRSGGARPGAGRKPKRPAEDAAGGAAVSVELEPQAHGGALKRSHAESVPMGDRDMLELLQDVALGRVQATALQVRAAIAAVQYTHTKRHDGGKKDDVDSKAKQAAAGKFAAAAPPLKLVGQR